MSAFFFSSGCVTFPQGDCWICMELMDTSLDKFYKFIYERMHERLPENMLGKITVAVSRCLLVCSVGGGGACL